MEFNKTFFLRAGTIILGVLIALLGFYEIIKSLALSATESMGVESPYSDFGNFTLGIFYIIIGYISYFIGKNWDNIFKGLSKTLISVSSILISFAIVILVIQNHSSELVENVQPDIDYILAFSIDDLLEQNIEIRNDEIVKLTLSENVIVKEIHNNNLTNNDANIFVEQLQLDEEVDDSKAMFLTKLFISTGYEEITKENSEGAKIPVPISQVKSQAATMGVDINLLASMNENLITQFYEINDDAYLTFLISENDIEKEMTIGKLTQEDINLIWENLNFEENISTESKEKIINIFLSLMKAEIDKLNIGNVAIPLATIQSMIPKEMVEIFKYDIFNQNITLRAGEIAKLRTSCQKGKIDLKELCEGIQMSDYNYFMTNLNELTKTANVEVPESISKTVENVNTIEKLESFLIEKSSIWKILLFVAIILIILANAVYYAHFKVFDRELIPIHIPYFIAKTNFINFIPSFIILIVIVVFASSESAINMASSIVPSNGINFAELLPNLGMYKVTSKILIDTIYYSLGYLIISGLIYLGLYFALKKEIKKLESSVKIEEELNKEI